MFPHNWQSVRELLTRMDFLLLFLALVLLVVGCLTIYSTGQQAGGNFAGFWLRQLGWIGIGSAAFLLVAMFDYARLGRWSWLFYLIGLALLVLVLLVGPRINSARSWIPLFGVTLQPAELAKPATLLFFAWLASRTRFRLTRVQYLLPLLVVLSVPMILVGMQPDWGTAIVFAFMIVPVIFVGGLPWKWILAGLVLALSLAPVVYHSALTTKQKDRIMTFLRPSQDVTDAGWNAHQSLLAVGSGGLTGKGFMRGTQHVLGFLPRTVAPTDFVFSVIAEENGFLGSILVVAVFLGLVLRCLWIAGTAGDDFGAYLAVGVASLFFAHAYINIGMNIRAAPIIGIPLPLVSYGGSFVVGSLICLGLVQAVHIRRSPV